MYITMCSCYYVGDQYTRLVRCDSQYPWMYVYYVGVGFTSKHIDTCFFVVLCVMFSKGSFTTGNGQENSSMFAVLAGHPFY